jgi:hypothetical protein
LDDLNARINKNRADAAAIEGAIPGAVIASSDGAATERRELASLQSEHTALVTAVEATRREIAEAHAREQAAEVEKAWDRLKELGLESAQIGAELHAAIKSVVEVAGRLFAADAAFCAAVPAKTPDWWPQRFAGGLFGLIAIELYVHSNGALRPADLIQSIQSPSLLSQNPLKSIEGALREHIGMAFKARPAKPQEPSGDEAA